MQRFKSKADLVRSTLSYAWDGLDEKTAALSAKVPKTPDGAVQLLTMLSKDYGEIEAYADALLILREDLRDPALRARGAKWKAVLTRALEDCFGQIAARAARHRPADGVAMAGLAAVVELRSARAGWSSTSRTDSGAIRLGDHRRQATGRQDLKAAVVKAAGRAT